MNDGIWGRAKTKWRQLNPRYVVPSDNFRRAFFHACREGFCGFFAPLRFCWWLIIQSWRSDKVNEL